MPELFTDDYEKIKQKWIDAKNTYDEATRLYDAIHILLKHTHEEFEKASKEFNAKQLTIIKNAKRANLQSVKKDKENGSNN
jgi:hypothetical protein